MSHVSAGKKTTVALESNDSHFFVVDRAVAMECHVIKILFGDDEWPDDLIIRLPNVNSVALAMIIEYVEKHLEFKARSASEREIQEFDAEFGTGLDRTSLYELIHASDYLHVKDLLKLLLLKVSRKGKRNRQDQESFRGQFILSPSGVGKWIPA